jgi:hypothetical protein
MKGRLGIYIARCFQRQSEGKRFGLVVGGLRFTDGTKRLAWPTGDRPNLSVTDKIWSPKVITASDAAQGESLQARDSLVHQN